MRQQDREGSGTHRFAIILMKLKSFYLLSCEWPVFFPFHQPVHKTMRPSSRSTNKGDFLMSSLTIAKVLTKYPVLEASLRHSGNSRPKTIKRTKTRILSLLSRNYFKLNTAVTLHEQIASMMNSETSLISRRQFQHFQRSPKAFSTRIIIIIII